MAWTIYNFDADIFSVSVRTRPRRVTIKQILKKIGCKNLSLEKVDPICSGTWNYFVFTYDTHPDLDGEDRPEWAEWHQQSVPVHKLNHMSLDQWVDVGLEIVNIMEN